ncbi:MAG: efflux RND transporter permease subunit [Haliea sp.]|nr:efflux RND transporter permease subunit [Haliea sp.]
MNFSAWAIRKPTPSILLFIMLTVAGLVAFRGLGVQYMPDMDYPAVIVTASLPGAGPEQVEAEVARPIEDSISSIAGVRHVTTTINDGSARIFVDFAVEKNLQIALTDVRDAVTRVRSMLPSDLQEPVVSRVDFSGLAVLTYAVVAPDMDAADLSWFVDDVIGKSLLQQHGVAQIRRQGGVIREVRVELDPLRLQALGVTAGEISSQLRKVQQEAPGGRGNLGGLEQSVRTLGSVSTAAELRKLSLPLLDGRRVQLADVAEVRDTTAERRSLALFDGKQIISFEVVRARGIDEVTTAKNVRAAVAALQAAHPRVQIIEIGNAVDYAQGEYQFAMNMLYEGAILAVLVVWLFLRDWRATFISAVALPLSIIPTFIVMHVLGYSLNTLTLLALTLVIGILVDDAIVEVENILRHLKMGKPPIQAAMEAADEIGLAVIATSLTLVAVFLPTAFTGGITGVFFRQFGITAAAAVLFSLLVARLLTPMMSAYLLKPPTHAHDGAPGPIMRRYLAAVRWCLEHPAITLGSASALFFGSLLMITQLPLAFVSARDNSMELVTLEAPPGSTLEQTAAVAQQADAILQAIPEIESVYTAIGSGVQASDSFDSSSDADVRSARITVRFAAQRERKLVDVRKAMREELSRIPGVRVGIGRSRPGEKMALMLTGDDPVTLREVAQNVETELRTLQGIGGVTSSASLRRPEIVIRPDFARAAELGVTSAAIGQAVHVATTGDYDFNLPRMNLPGRQVFVRVMLDPSSRQDPQMIAQLRVSGDAGAAIPLGNIAQITVADGPAQIDRYDRQRYVSLEVELQGLPIGDVLKEAQALPSLRHLPPGVTLQLSGDLEEMTEMLDEFSLAMIAGIFCVYAVMVLLFHDFGQPLTVLAALPLASTGALGLMWLFGYALSMASLIGLLILIGIVTKNSILLVDYAIIARSSFGLGRVDAMIDACHKRARPIVMTTVAMGAGMMPIALGFDGEDSFRAPMAVVVIGGLITSTILSLLVVPVVFVVVDRIKRRLIPRGPEAMMDAAR